MLGSLLNSFQAIDLLSVESVLFAGLSFNIFFLPLFNLQAACNYVKTADIVGIDWTYLDHLTSSPILVSSHVTRITPGSILLTLYVVVSTIEKDINKLTHTFNFKTDGTPVYATAEGTVLKAAFLKGWGKLVVIQYETGYETLYAHLNEIGVEAGDEVKMGEIIGGLGSSGQSTGPHLHYEVRKGGENVNPADYY